MRGEISDLGDHAAPAAATWPAKFILITDARASGMSISGIRTAYDEDEIAEVAKLTGTRPRRPAEAP